MKQWQRRPPNDLLRSARCCFSENARRCLHHFSKSSWLSCFNCFKRSRDRNRSSLCASNHSFTYSATFARCRSLSYFAIGIITGLLISNLLYNVAIRACPKFNCCYKLYELVQNGGGQSRDGNHSFEFEPIDRLKWLNNTYQLELLLKRGSLNDQYRYQYRLRSDGESANCSSCVRRGRNLVLVGVMTADKFLHSRASAVNSSWAHSIPGSVLYFASGWNKLQHRPSDYPDRVPIVKLPNVTDDYPPQRKSFRMLKFMADAYGDAFDWFMRVDDDLFVRGDRLEALLSRLDADKPLLIGQAGTGLLWEQPKLALGAGDNFCMGGTGVIFSRALLRQLSPHLARCMSQLRSAHEDVEVSRCVFSAAKVRCLWAHELASFLFQNYQRESHSYNHSLVDEALLRTLTLHPVKQPAFQRRLSNFFRFEALQIAELERVQLRRQLRSSLLAQPLGGPLRVSFDASLPNLDVCVDQGANVTRRTWIAFERDRAMSHEFANPRLARTEASPRRIAHSVLQNAVFEMNREAHDRRRLVELKEPLYASELLLFGSSTRLPANSSSWQDEAADQSDGYYYMLDVLLSYNDFRRRGGYPVRRHVYYKQSLLRPRVSQQQDNTVDAAKLVLIVPLGMVTNKTRAALRFLENYEREVLYDPELRVRTSLVLVSCAGSTDGNGTKWFGDEVNSLKRRVARRFGGELAESIQLIERPGEFSRAAALNTGGLFVAPVRFNSGVAAVQPKQAAMAGRIDSQIDADVQNLVESHAVGENVRMIDEHEPLQNHDQREVVLEIENRESARQIHLEDRDEDADVSLEDEKARKQAKIDALQLEVESDPLLFFIDVDMTFSRDALIRASLNVKRGRSVYSPIVKSEFDTNNDAFEAEAYWRSYGFGMLAMYASDWHAVGRWNEAIDGSWGFEDVEMFERLVSDEKLDVIRAPDPGLVHSFHAIECDRLLERVSVTPSTVNRLQNRRKDAAKPNAVVRAVKSNWTGLEEANDFAKRYKMCVGSKYANSISNQAAFDRLSRRFR